MAKQVNQNFYKLFRANDIKLRPVFSKLKSLYEKIPSTNGCLENNCKEKGCGSWCCQIQTPQLLYSEFLHIMNYALRKWDYDKISTIIDKSVKNYVAGFTTKGCVFFDNTTKLCMVHKVRPYNCRIYGITPTVEFSPRYLKALETYKGIFGAIIKDQCDLCKTENGEPITTEDTNKWWNKLVEIEFVAGIRKELVNDFQGGSYRTPHDHILLYFFPDEILDNLQTIRLYATEEEKRVATECFLDGFHKKLKALQG